MASLSLQQRISKLRRQLDPTRRLTDLAARAVLFERRDGRIVRTGQSRVFGGVWDNWARRYTGDKPQDIIEIPIGATQWQWIAPFVEQPNSRTLICAGRGSGKTHSIDIAATLLGLELPHGQLQVVSPTYALSELLRDKLLNDLPTARWIHPSAKGIQVARRRIVLRNGFTIRFASADNERSLRGGDADAVLVDERQDVSQRGVDIVTFQLRKRGGYRLLQVGTPLVGTDFHGEHEAYLGRVERGEKAHVFRGTSYDNPFIPHAIFEDAKRGMDEGVYRQEVLGEWVPLGGRVYPYLDAELHFRDSNRWQRVLRDLFKDRYFPQDITRAVAKRRLGMAAEYVVGLDWGVRPMCGSVWKVFSTPDGVEDLLWCVDEVELLDKGSPDMYAAELRRRGYTPANTVIVADASDTDAPSFYRLMRKRGYKVVKPSVRHQRNPDIADRVNAVNAKLLNAEGEITLLFDDKRARNTAWAFHNQALDSNGKPERDDSNHRTAAGGYAVVRLYPAASAKTIQARYAA